jgi:hypothetical protein
MHSITNTELSSHEETRCQFNGGRADIKLGIDVHQDFYVVVMQVGGSNPKPPQRFQKQAFLHWATKLKQSGAEVYAVYEACGFGFSLQRQLNALGINCYVVCPQKLDECNKRVKTDGLDAKALCLKLDRFVQGNRDALAIVRVPSEEEERSRAIHRQREQFGGDTQTTGSSGSQSPGQSRFGPGAKLVEAAHLCATASAAVDERAASKQPTDPACVAGKDRCAHAATAKRRGSQPTARTGEDDQCGDRSGRLAIGTGLTTAVRLPATLVFARASTPVAIHGCKAA